MCEQNRQPWILCCAIGLCLLLASAGFPACAKPPAKPAAARSVVIYSPHPEEILEYVTREFRQRTGIQVEIISAGTGELLERMRQSGRKGEADIFWGGGVDSLETVKELFQSYVSDADPYIRSDLRPEHRLWYPFSVLPAVIVYNEKLVPPEHIPVSWASLLDPYYHNRLIIADPLRSGSSYTILCTILQTMSAGQSDYDAGWDYVEKLIHQLGSTGLASSSSLVFQSVASGDFFAGITFENSVLELRKTGANISWCYPEEGTSALPDGIALLKDARHSAEAALFIDFALSRDVQELLMPRWQRRSVRTDTTALPAVLTARTTMNLIDYSISEAAAGREAILSRWSARYNSRLP